MKRRAERLISFVPEGLFLFFLALAFHVAWGSVHDLSWPCEEDFWRDMGFARTILDGRYGEDPFYLGEKVWYNPLVHGLVALVTKISGAPLELVYTRSGAFLNLLVPVGFYSLVAYAFSRWTALASVTAFLFLGVFERVSWQDNATYSPWLWPENFAQGLLYVTLLMALRAQDSGSRRWRLGSGALLGLTALAQNTPAFVAGTILVTMALGRLLRKEGSSLRTEVRGLLEVLGVAFLVALPFTIYLVGHYRLAVVNRGGIHWAEELFQLEAWKTLAYEQLSLRGAMGVLGLVLLFIPRLADRDGKAPGRRVLVATWAGVTLGYIVYSFLIQVGVEGGMRSSLPGIAPGWHFLLYFRAVESLLFGLAVARLAKLGRALAEARSAGGASRPRVFAGLEGGLVAAASIGLAVAIFPAYRDRADIKQNREAALVYAGRYEHSAISKWILENTRPDDVFLASFRQSVFAVAPTGRKVVRMPDEFANPFVDPKPRAQAVEAMWSAAQWQKSDPDALLAWAKRFHVRYVIMEPNIQTEDDLDLLPVYLGAYPFMKLAFRVQRPYHTDDQGRKLSDGPPCPWAVTDCDLVGGMIDIYRVDLGP